MSWPARCATRSVASKGIFCASLVVALLGRSPTVARAVDVGAPAPEIGVRDTAGAFISLAELRGSIAVVAFFESSLPESEQLLAGLERIHERHAGGGVLVIAIATDLDAEGFEAFTARRRLPFRIAHDAEWSAVGRFEPRTMPSTYVLDAGGVVRHVQNGGSSLAELDRSVQFLSSSLGVPLPPPPVFPAPIDPGGPGAGWVALGVVLGFFGGALAVGGVVTLICATGNGGLGCLVGAIGGGLGGGIFGSIAGGAGAGAAATPDSPTLTVADSLRLRLSF
jgi:peroxiredoxin